MLIGFSGFIFLVVLYFRMGALLFWLLVVVTLWLTAWHEESFVAFAGGIAVTTLWTYIAWLTISPAQRAKRAELETERQKQQAEHAVRIRAVGIEWDDRWDRIVVDAFFENTVIGRHYFSLWFGCVLGGMFFAGFVALNFGGCAGRSFCLAALPYFLFAWIAGFTLLGLVWCHMNPWVVMHWRWARSRALRQWQAHIASPATSERT